MLRAIRSLHVLVWVAIVLLGVPAFGQSPTNWKGDPGYLYDTHLRIGQLDIDRFKKIVQLKKEVDFMDPSSFTLNFALRATRNGSVVYDGLSTGIPTSLLDEVTATILADHGVSDETIYTLKLGSLMDMQQLLKSNPRTVVGAIGYFDAVPPAPWSQMVVGISQDKIIHGIIFARQLDSAEDLKNFESSLNEELKSKFFSFRSDQSLSRDLYNRVNTDFTNVDVSLYGVEGIDKISSVVFHKPLDVLEHGTQANYGEYLPVFQSDEIEKVSFHVDRTKRLVLMSVDGMNLMNLRASTTKFDFSGM